MSKALKGILLAGLSLLGICTMAESVPGKPGVSAVSIEAKPCWFKAEKDWPKAECGVLQVPENYQLAGSAKVRLPFVIFKPEAPKAGRAPVLVAGGGGPGNGLGIDPESPEDFYPGLWSDWYFSTHLSGRDLILIDNRGVGSSRPRLNCPNLEAFEMVALAQDLKPEQYQQQQAQQVYRCRERLSQQGIDIRQYHIDNAARDLEALRQALKLGRWHVYGISYGSRIAQRYQQLFPTSINSLVLDGVYPLQQDSFANLHQDNMQAWDRMFTRCQQQLLCRLRFGFDLQPRFEAFLLALKPQAVQLNYQGKELTIVLDGDIILAAVWSALYYENNISKLPLALHKAMEGDYEKLLQLVSKEVVENIDKYSLDEAAYASYACYDENPFANFAKARSDIQGHSLGQRLNGVYIEQEQALCQLWQIPPGPEDLKQPKKINVPVLLLSGALDNATPAHWAEVIAKQAPLHYSRIWSDVSHGVMSASICADRYMASFLNKPRENPFTEACEDSVEELRFDLF